MTRIPPAGDFTTTPYEFDARENAGTLLRMWGSWGGTPIITIADYESNPGGTPGFISMGKYIDVHLLYEAGEVDGIEIRLYYEDEDIVDLEESLLGLYWWDGSEWVKCSNTGVTEEAEGGYIWAIIDDTTTPGLSDLTGSPFAAGNPEEYIPVGGDVYPVNKVSVLMPWVAMAVAIVAGGIFVIRRKSSI